MTTEKPDDEPNPIKRARSHLNTVWSEISGINKDAPDAVQLGKWVAALKRINDVVSADTAKSKTYQDAARELGTIAEAIETSRDRIVGTWSRYHDELNAAYDALVQAADYLAKGPVPSVVGLWRPRQS